MGVILPPLYPLKCRFAVKAKVGRHHNRGAKIGLFFGIRRAAERAFFILVFHIIQVFATAARRTQSKIITETDF